MLFRLKIREHIVFRRVSLEVTSRFQRMALKKSKLDAGLKSDDETRRRRERDARRASLDISHGTVYMLMGTPSSNIHIDRKIRYGQSERFVTSTHHTSPIFLIRRGQVRSRPLDVAFCDLQTEISLNDRDVHIH